MSVRSVYVVGMGPVGLSLVLSLRSAGVEVTGICERDRDRGSRAHRVLGMQFDESLGASGMLDADAVLAAVGDGEVLRLAREAVKVKAYGEEQCWLHCSGALSVEALAPVASVVRGTGSMHPALVFPPGSARVIPKESAFAVAGDRAGLDAARSLVTAIGGRAMGVGDDDRAAYHAALVFCSNYLVVLLERSSRILLRNGMREEDARRVVMGLARDALAAAEREGLAESLSGPVRRGDSGTVERHLKALEAEPETLELYTCLARAAAEVSIGLEGDRREAFEEVLAALEAFASVRGSDS